VGEVVGARALLSRKVRGNRNAKKEKIQKTILSVYCKKEQECLILKRGLNERRKDQQQAERAKMQLIVAFKPRGETMREGGENMNGENRFWRKKEKEKQRKILQLKPN